MNIATSMAYGLKKYRIATEFCEGLQSLDCNPFSIGIKYNRICDSKYLLTRN